MVETEPRTHASNVVTSPTAFLVFDTESVPDGRLLREVKYRGENLTDDEAIERAQQEAREKSPSGSDFLPASFHLPVAVCVAKVGRDFHLQSVTCLDSPQYRIPEIARLFWSGLRANASHDKAKLVTFNGRGFDLPMMEMAAFRYGLQAKAYYLSSRGRFNDGSLDLMDWFNNFGAIRHVGGINLLAKIIGKPGKIDISGDQVYALWKEGRLAEINDYCMSDTLDTYFVFLRTCVMRGDLTREEEADRILKAREQIEAKVLDYPALKIYLDNWTEETPWP